MFQFQGHDAIQAMRLNCANTRRHQAGSLAAACARGHARGPNGAQRRAAHWGPAGRPTSGARRQAGGAATRSNCATQGPGGVAGGAPTAPRFGAQSDDPARIEGLAAGSGDLDAPMQRAEARVCATGRQEVVWREQVQYSHSLRGCVRACITFGGHARAGRAKVGPAPLVRTLPVGRLLPVAHPNRSGARAINWALPGLLAGAPKFICAGRADQRPAPVVPLTLDWRPPAGALHWRTGARIM